MAKLIQQIERVAQTPEQLEEQSLQELLLMLTQNKDSLVETMKIVQELHESGILEAMYSLLQAKEKVAKILVNQTLRPEATTMVNNAMNVAGVLTKIDPEVSSKLMNSVVVGLDGAGETLNHSYKTGVFELAKSLNDPDVTKGLSFMLAFLKGFGRELSRN